MKFLTSPPLLSAIRQTACAALLLALFCASADAAAITRTSTDGPVSVTATVDQETAQIAEPVTLTLKVDVPENVLVTLPQEQAKLGTFNVLGTQDAPDLPTAEGRQWIRRYQLESLTPGEQSIPPITIAYSDTRTASPTSDIAQSSPLSVTITSSLEGTPDPLQFRDIKGVVELPVDESPSNAWLYGSLGGGAVLALAGAALLVWPSRNGKRSPQAQALADLEALRRSDLLRAGQTEQFYVRLTNIVRNYVEQQFDIAAPKLTTDEFLDQAASGSVLHGQQRAMLRVFLSLADLVKFAQFEPDQSDANQAIDRARQFIQQTADQQPSETSQAAPQEDA
ncbi:hypothetical protein [Blastopirellula retiformator]|uniref:Protein BatD n=1 Tax=Blastopirellula retiformator TaxID=2527970 RepID=A0A5C5VM74_9BACT|nr:hypothetical protein [Blastopirellula retiformator]TWT38975.1 hypothetical protein Enr8_06700 [Blastopirellula retiformator]